MDSQFEKLDPDSALRPTIINVGGLPKVSNGTGNASKTAWARNTKKARPGGLFPSRFLGITGEDYVNHIQTLLALGDVRITKWRFGSKKSS